MRPAVRRVLELNRSTLLQGEGYFPNVVAVGIAHRVTVTTPVVPCTVHLRRREALGYFVHVHLEGHIRVLRTRDVEDRRVVHRSIRGRTVVESTPWCAVHRGQRGVNRAHGCHPMGTRCPLGTNLRSFRRPNHHHTSR